MRASCPTCASSGPRPELEALAAEASPSGRVAPAGGPAGGLTDEEARDEARRCLGLGETAIPGEIRRAYHRLAAQLHPDHNPDDPEAEARMTELAQAYELLTAYAEAVHGCRGAEEQGSRGSEERQSAIGNRKSKIRFSREVVERTLLIAIQRQEVPV